MAATLRAMTMLLSLGVIVLSLVGLAPQTAHCVWDKPLDNYLPIWRRQGREQELLKLYEMPKENRRKINEQSGITKSMANPDIKGAEEMIKKWQDDDLFECFEIVFFGDWIYYTYDDFPLHCCLLDLLRFVPQCRLKSKPTTTTTTTKKPTTTKKTNTTTTTKKSNTTRKITTVKPPDKSLVGGKTSSKPAGKPAPKRTSKPAVKPAPKKTSKPAGKPAPKQTSKPAVKPAPKKTSKPAGKPAPKQTSKPAGKPAPKQTSYQQPKQATTGKPNKNTIKPTSRKILHPQGKQPAKSSATSKAPAKTTRKPAGR